ncbi:MAG: restriction endonuclease subunit S [Anaerolineae bacterium]
MTNGGDAPRALSEPVWLDGVPTHWKIDRLKWSITGLFNGVWGDEPNGIDDIICVRVADFDRTRLKVTDDPPTRRAIEIKDRTNRLLHTGDLLIEKSGGGDNQPVGCVVYFDHGYDAICSNFIGRMVIAPGMHPRYWSYAHASLYTGRLNIPAIKQTTGIQNLDTDAYLNQRVAYPLLEEQCVIANYLDRETAQIDALMAAKERLLTLLAEKRRALITRAVTRGLDPDVPLRDSGLPWLVEVPAHWKFAGFTKYLRSLVDYRGKTPEKVPSGVFLVTARNIKDGYIDYEASQEFVEADAYDEVMQRGKPKIGDLLLTTEAPLGQAALVDREDIALAQRVIKLDYDPRILLNEFALVWIRSAPFQWQLGSFATGSTALGIKGERLHMLRNLLPPIDEQRAIVAHIAAETARLDALAAATVRSLALLKERRAALIAAAVTGRIDMLRDAVQQGKGEVSC